MAEKPESNQQKQSATESAVDPEENKLADSIRPVQVKNTSTVAAVIAAVLVAVALIMLGYAIYNQDDPETVQEQIDSNNEDEANAETEDVNSEVQPQDIDQAIQEIDSELNNLSDDDFNESALSDDELGL